MISALSSGDPVIIPTDTVYGVAADPRVEGATDRLFALKGRPPEKALPILGGSIETLRSVAVFDERAEDLARRFWPGPLTLVLSRTDDCRWRLGGDDETTVAVRIPDHPLALELLRSYGALAVSSANRTGEPPATTAQMAQKAFDTPPVALDGGSCQGGTASTVLSLVGEPRILRAGDLSLEDLSL